MKTIIALLAGSFCFVIGCITVITVTGNDATPMLQFFLALVPLIAGQVYQLRQQAKNSQTLEKIDKNVNGHMTTLIDNALPGKHVRSDSDA